MSGTNENSSVSVLHLAGSKLRSKLTSHWNEAAASSMSSFGKKQLEKMGWQEGTGLGKRRTGISSHIRVQRRADEQSGLGNSKQSTLLTNGDAATMAVHTEDWWKSSVGDTLAKLSKNSKKKSKTKSKSTSKRVYTDEELFEATGGARFGMRAQAPQRGKWQRTESSEATYKVTQKILEVDEKQSVGSTQNKKRKIEGKSHDRMAAKEMESKKEKRERKMRKKEKKEEKRNSKRRKTEPK